MTADVRPPPLPKSAKAPNACMGMYLAHAVYPRSGMWWVARVTLDGEGRELGRSERACFSHESACEIMRYDALKLAPHLYRTLAAAERQVQVLREEDASRREQHAHLRRAAHALWVRRDALKDRIRGERAKLDTGLPREADVRPPPADAPTHVVMRWEKPLTHEQVEASIEAMEAEAMELEIAHEDALRGEKEAEPLPDLEKRCAAALAKGLAEWRAKAPELAGVPWG